MKSISASIVVLSSSILIAVGSTVAHHDTRLFVQVVGCIVGLLGLISWFKTLITSAQD